MATQVTLNSGSVDSAGSLLLRTNGTTTAVTIGTDQSVTTAGTINGLTVGKGAGAVSTNTAVGASALAANSTGARVTAIGYRAGVATTAGNNAFIGSYAGEANTSGNFNAVLGDAALPANTSGSNNVAVGQGSLNANTTASNNTAVGYQAGYSNTTGLYNTFVGNKAGYSFNTSGDTYNAFIGNQSGYSVTTGIQNTFVGGANPGYYVTTGSKNTILGNYTGNQGGLDIRTASNYIVLSDGDGNPRGWFASNGVPYIPAAYTVTTGNAANMWINNDGGFVRSVSAAKYKTNVRDLEEIDINLLRAVRYNSLSAIDDEAKDHFGIIADEAESAGLVELVSYGADGEVEGFQYERLTVVLLKAMQTLKAEVDSLKAQINGA